MKGIDLLAFYGAIMGTIATAHLIYQWYLDRPKLKLNAALIIYHEGGNRVKFDMSVVNIGRRPVRIGLVAVLLEKPEPNVLESIMPIFSDKGQTPLELSPDGGQQIWSKPVERRVPFEKHKKGEYEFGRVYVMLTSGKRIFCEFPLLEEQYWPVMESPSTNTGQVTKEGTSTPKPVDKGTNPIPHRESAVRK
jgi:hypothetical protein